MTCVSTFTMDAVFYWNFVMRIFIDCMTVSENSVPNMIIQSFHDANGKGVHFTRWCVRQMQAFRHNIGNELHSWQKHPSNPIPVTSFLTISRRRNRNTIEGRGGGGWHERLQSSQLSVRRVHMRRSKLGGFSPPSPPGSAALDNQCANIQSVLVDFGKLVILRMLNSTPPYCNSATSIYVG